MGTGVDPKTGVPMWSFHDNFESVQYVLFSLNDGKDSVLGLYHSYSGMQIVNGSSGILMSVIGRMSGMRGFQAF